MTHTYAWGNNETRAALKHRHCRVLVRGRRHSVLVEFENGERVVTSAARFGRLSRKGTWLVEGNLTGVVETAL
jgi:hypothetical protein